MENMESIISCHNKNILNTPQTTQKDWCNCGTKANCPLNNKCLSTSLIYKANVTTNNDPNGKNYMGLTEGSFKRRYTQHTLSFRDPKYSNTTKLSKHIWDLKNSQTTYSIHWSILSHAPAYSNKTKKCNLCLAEKVRILQADKNTLLNTRSELVSKCCHENKFYQSNFKT